MTDQITLQNVFYKIRSKGEPTASFPAPGRKSGAKTKIKVEFKNTQEFMFLTVDEHVTVDFSSDSNDENFSNQSITLRIDQTPADVLNQGIDTDKIVVEGLTNSAARTSKVLNALEYAYYYALGKRNHGRDLHI